MVIGTFSPRYMRLWYRDRLFKFTLALLVGSLTFSFSMLRRIEPDYVPNAGVSLSGVLVVASLILFLFFFDRCMHRLRPVAVASLVAEAGRKAFDETIQVHRSNRSRDRGALAGRRAHGDRSGDRCRHDPGDPLPRASSAGPASTTRSSFSARRRRSASAGGMLATHLRGARRSRGRRA